MPSRISTEARSNGTGIIIRVTGVLDVNTMEKFDNEVRPLLRPRSEITLDFKDAVIRGKGILKLLGMQSQNPLCIMKLANVAPSSKSAFERCGAASLGLAVEYRVDASE
jgi:hypothetical protein